MNVLVDTNLHRFIDDAVISPLSEGIVLHDYVQPASIDLPVGDEIFLVQQKFLPFQKSVAELVEEGCVERFGTNEGVVLYKGQTYLIPCLHLDLSSEISAKISSKSSIGRIDVLVRTVFDHTGLYDTVLSGSTGQLWLEVTPQSFNIKIKKGVALSQIMFFEQSHEHIVFEDIQEQFIFRDGKAVPPRMYNDHMLISLGLHDDVVGYQARYTNKIIDLEHIAAHDAHDFFEPVSLLPNTEHKQLHLEKDRFYILATDEEIRVPIAYSIELVPFSHLVGEMRVHYAGFFDPGLGGDIGATGVLEVRTHEDLLMHHGQPICLAQVYKNIALPEKPYGVAGNNYQGQKGPKLAKYFR